MCNCSSNSSTGYSQCKWSNERVPEHGNVRCIPDTNNDCTPSETCGSKKCCGFIVREGSRWRIKKKKKN